MTSLRRWHPLSQGSPGLPHRWQVKKTKQQVANTAVGFSGCGVVLPWAGRQLLAPWSIPQQLSLAPYVPPELKITLLAGCIHLVWGCRGWAANKGVDACALNMKSE